jgi:hypothetical protein
MTIREAESARLNRVTEHLGHSTIAIMLDLYSHCDAGNRPGCHRSHLCDDVRRVNGEQHHHVRSGEPLCIEIDSRKLVDVRPWQLAATP